jgi:uncharacterized Zn-binding protein involved in type VI secretion
MKGVARLNDTISHGGTIVEASPDVKVNGRGVARLGDSVNCSQHGSQTITGASQTVKANSKRVARLNDSISCGAVISSASTDVKIGS